ncbi:2-oxoglutarate dehydrogenase E1 component [Geobacillus stearothermophilus]|uniref:oxoglutarate dehydrogenase (succinyl-transferring) n=1 Tax=Geobacillus stearothermophilus TaxID=1422 RepID=A0A150M8U2_GEOSE|nr:2-oxoglutarate dehydrogenase E1 component [Geobacillus stearothermophilus]
MLEQPGLGADAGKVERIVFGTGKLMIDLAEQIGKMEGLDWLHIVRIEELYPFPEEAVRDIIARYPNVKELVWVQEEPKNMGAWLYMEPRLRALAPEGVDVSYIGRRRRASPAEGDPVVHRKEQERIIRCALTKHE